MSDTLEVLLTSDSSLNSSSACVWDYKAGTSLHYYRNAGSVSPRSIAFIGNDYFVAAERLKPLIHVWQINSQEPLKQTRVVTPGPVSALAVSPGGNYCVAGISEQIYVWQTATGNLLSIAARHFQPIVKILFSSDGSRIISAAEDGLVIVWLLSELISQQAGQRDPLYVLSEHTLPVRDISLSCSTRNANLISVSADNTLKIHQFDSGELLLSVVYDTALTAVTCNAIGAIIFVGCTNGNIHELSLLNPPRSRAYHVDLAKDKSITYSGHTQSITSLSLSTDGLTLASSSNNGQVILWHVPTKQKLKTIDNGNTITNALFATAPTNMFTEEFKPIIVFNSFQREMIREENIHNTVQVLHTESLRLPFSETSEIVSSHISDISSTDTVANLKAEIDKLKKINAQMYKFSLDHIIKGTCDGGDLKTQTGDLVQHKKKKRKRVD